MAFTLITAANSAKAHQLKKMLNTSDTLLGDFMEIPEIMVRSGKMIRLPNPAHIAYIHEILTLCLDNNISLIYALRPAEQSVLVQASLLFNEYNIKIQLSENEI